MTRPALPIACCGAACLALLAGCVADRSSPPRPALWSSHKPEGEGAWIGGRDKPSPKLGIAYGKMQEQMGNYADARKSYNSVLGTDPRSVDAMLGLARLDQLAGKNEEAEQGFQKALRLRPKDPATLDAVGQFYASRERWSEAITCLNSATLADPDKRDYRYHLGVAMARSGDLEGALPHLVKTVGDAEAHYNIGYILYEKKDLAAAEKYFLTATLKQPNLAVAQQMLDEIRNGQNDNEVLTASSNEKPRLERSLPFPTNEKAPQRPINADYRSARRTAALPTTDTTAATTDPAPWNGGQSSDRRQEVAPYSPASSSSEPPQWPGKADARSENEVPFGAAATAPATYQQPAPAPYQPGGAMPGHSTEPEPYPSQTQQWSSRQR